LPYDFELTDELSGLKAIQGFHLLGCLRNSLFSFKSNPREMMKLSLPPLAFSLFNNEVGVQLFLRIHKFRHAQKLRHILDAHDKYILLAAPNRMELDYFVGDYQS
jgi:hypothetical protein